MKVFEEFELQKNCMNPTLRYNWGLILGFAWLSAQQIMWPDNLLWSHNKTQTVSCLYDSMPLQLMYFNMSAASMLSTLSSRLCVPLTAKKTEF